MNIKLRRETFIPHKTGIQLTQATYELDDQDKTISPGQKVKVIGSYGRADKITHVESIEADSQGASITDSDNFHFSL